jgi:MFS family permease
MSKKTIWALSGLSLSMLLPSLDTSIANVGLPTLAQAFSATFHQVQWIILAYLLAVTTLIIGAGRLGDVAGRRRMLLVGILVFTIASVLCGLAPTLWLLIAARAVQGIGAALMIALTLALAKETVPPEKTGSAMGLLGTMSAIGTALGPSLGGLLIAALGWRSMFLVNVPVGIAAWLLVQRCLPADAAESRAASPRIQLQMLRDRALSGSLAMSAIVATVMMSTLVVGPFYLSRALGLDAARVGFVMSAGPLVAALTGVPAGRIVDRWGAQRITIMGLFGIAAGSLLLAMMPARFGIAGYIAPIVVITAHYALFQTANNTAVLTNIRQDQRGVISGMLSLSRNVGLIAGASVMGAIFAASSMRITFVVAAVLILGASSIAVRARACECA